MAHPAPEVLAWASAVLGSEVTVVRSLRLGGPPWLLRADSLRADGLRAGGRNVVLRVIAASRARRTCCARPKRPWPGQTRLQRTVPERPEPWRPGPGRMTAGLAWCTVTCGTATRCGTRAAA